MLSYSAWWLVIKMSIFYHFLDPGFSFPYFVACKMFSSLKFSVSTIYFSFLYSFKIIWLIRVALTIIILKRIFFTFPIRVQVGPNQISLTLWLLFQSTHPFVGVYILKPDLWVDLFEIKLLLAVRRWGKFIQLILWSASILIVLLQRRSFYS